MLPATRVDLRQLTAGDRKRIAKKGLDLLKLDQQITNFLQEAVLEYIKGIEAPIRRVGDPKAFLHKALSRMSEQPPIEPSRSGDDLAQVPSENLYDFVDEWAFKNDLEDFATAAARINEAIMDLAKELKKSETDDMMLSSISHRTQQINALSTRAGPATSSSSGRPANFSNNDGAPPANSSDRRPTSTDHSKLTLPVESKSSQRRAVDRDRGLKNLLIPTDTPAALTRLQRNVEVSSKAAPSPEKAKGNARSRPPNYTTADQRRKRPIPFVDESDSSSTDPEHDQPDLQSAPIPFPPNKPVSQQPSQTVSAERRKRAKSPINEESEIVEISSGEGGSPKINKFAKLDKAATPSGARGAGWSTHRRHASSGQTGWLPLSNDDSRPKPGNASPLPRSSPAASAALRQKVHSAGSNGINQTGNEDKNPQGKRGDNIPAKPAVAASSTADEKGKKPSHVVPRSSTRSPTPSSSRPRKSLQDWVQHGKDAKEYDW